MVIDLPLDRMTVEEKLALIDKIWADLSKDPDSIPSPDWHREELERIQARIDRGEEKSRPWEEAKADILRRIHEG